MTLNEKLETMGLHAAECDGVYRRVIRDAEGNEVFRGSADEVWKWVRTQQ